MPVTVGALRSWRLFRHEITLIATDPVAKNTVLLTINSLVTGIGGAVYWLVATRLYPPAIVGVATAGTSIVILLSGVSQLGLGVSIIRYSAALGVFRARRLRGIFALTVSAACVAGGLFCVAVPYIANGLRSAFGSPLDAAYFIAACAGWTLSVQYDNYLMSRRFMGLLVLKNSSTGLSRIAMIVAIPHLPIAMVIAVTGVAGLLGVLSSLPIALRRPVPTAETTGPPVATRTLVNYSFWNYLSGLAGTMPALVMPTIIVTKIGGTQAAAYYMAATLFGILLLIPAALSWAILAEKSAVLHSHVRTPSIGQSRSGRLMLLLTALFVPLAVITLSVLGRSYFLYGWIVIVVLTLGIWPYHRAVLLMTEMRLAGSQRMLAGAYTVSQIAFMILTFPLLAVINIAGPALAWTFGQYLLFLWLWVVTRPSSANGVIK